jgi:hypothetical protein
MNCKEGQAKSMTTVLNTSINKPISLPPPPKKIAKNFPLQVFMVSTIFFK